jgi:hypothetical protein
MRESIFHLCLKFLIEIVRIMSSLFTKYKDYIHAIHCVKLKKNGNTAFILVPTGKFFYFGIFF